MERQGSSRTPRRLDVDGPKTRLYVRFSAHQHWVRTQGRRTGRAWDLSGEARTPGRNSDGRADLGRRWSRGKPGRGEDRRGVAGVVGDDLVGQGGGGAGFDQRLEV